MLHGNKYQLKEVKAKKTQTWPWHLLIRVLTALMPFKCRKKGGGSKRLSGENNLIHFNVFNMFNTNEKREKKNLLAGFLLYN